jgi:hypothetical protein
MDLSSFYHRFASFLLKLETIFSYIYKTKISTFRTDTKFFTNCDLMCGT